MAEVGPPAYAAHAERVHGTATPPRSGDVGIGRSQVGVVSSLA
ncbi:MAG: hypothetical protein ACRDPO_02505 [Streptosporangiaceae bacterium]